MAGGLHPHQKSQEKLVQPLPWHQLALTSLVPAGIEIVDSGTF